VTHAELEHARERDRRGRPDWKTLQNPDPRMRLHDAHEPNDRVAGHERVRIEGQHELEVAAASLTEIVQVSGLETRVVRPSPVDDPLRVRDLPLPGCHDRLLRRRDVRCCGIAEDEVGETLAEPRGVHAFFDRAKPRESADRILIAQGHHDGSSRVQRAAPVTRGGIGRDLCKTTFASVQDPQAERRIPEP
jgi:hypothetical protein